MESKLRRKEKNKKKRKEKRKRAAIEKIYQQARVYQQAIAKREERLNRKNEFGVTDITPFEAVEEMRRKGVRL